MTNYEKLCEVVGIAPCAKCVSQILCCEIDDKHPDFTAEKQIELIKLLMNAGCFTGYAYKTEAKQYILSYALKNYHNEDFSEALAGLALQIVEAGELNKEAVRKVLE